MTTPPAVTFGDWLRQRRKQLDLTQAALADLAGCSAAAIKKIEAGDRRPSRQVAALLARHLRLPVEQHTDFVRVARGELPLERLAAPAAPPAVALRRPALPLPATALLGREHELAAVARLLADPRCRLVTLTGPGGIGKTRLALQAAQAGQTAFGDGVAFAALAGLDTAAALPATLADALGFTLHGADTPRRQLLDYLRDKQLLLGLDNLEHLLDDDATLRWVDELLRAAPALKILATSREPLGLAGEWVLEVQGLPAPADAEHLATNSAAALFLERAQQARVGFTPTAGDRAAIARVCQLVEGMPLALELAAAWVQTLTCAEIAAEIARDLGLLAARGRAVPERHRSLRAVFDQSWERLGPAEQAALAALSVFRGGFTRAAAEAVAATTLPALAALIDHSLLRRADDGRYDLHELVRQYAAERLAEQTPGVRDRHAAYVLALWRDREAALKGAAQLDALGELSVEVNNLRAAWPWALPRGLVTELGGALEAVWAFAEMRGWLAEGADLFAQAAAAARAGGWEPVILARALTYQGWFVMRLGQFTPARGLFEEALARLTPAGAPLWRAKAALFLGILFYVAGDSPAAWERMNQAQALAEASGDRWLAAQVLINQQGLAGALTGRWAEAYAGMQAALDTLRDLGDTRTRITALNFYVISVALALGDYANLRRELEAARAFYEASRDRWGLALTWVNLGRLAQAQGAFDEARVLIQRGLDLHNELGARADSAFARLRLGQVEAAARQPGAAEAHLRAAIQLGLAVEALPTVLEAATELARLWATGEDTAGRALELDLWVLGHPACPPEQRAAVERHGQALAARLTPAQVATARGRVAAGVAGLLADAAPAR